MIQNRLLVHLTYPSEDLEDLVIYGRGLRKQYRENSKIKFRLIGRPLYPEKTFS